jgi:hypothetical protein
MSVYHTWLTDQESPGIPFALYASGTTTLLDLSTGYTVTVQLVRPSIVGALAPFLVVTQTASLTLYDGVGEDYNLTIDQWASATLTAISTDLTTTLGKSGATYEVRPYVRRTTGSLDEVPTSHEPLFVRFELAAA